MGNNQSQICISQNFQYKGQVNNKNIPHGKGVLYVYQSNNNQNLVISNKLTKDCHKKSQKQLKSNKENDTQKNIGNTQKQKNTPKQKYNYKQQDCIWKINGEFKQGDIARCEAFNQKQNIVYKGNIDQCFFNGLAVVMEGRRRKWEGKVSNGVFIDGVVGDLGGEYYWKGSYVLTESSNKNIKQQQATVHTERIKKTDKVYKLQCSQGQYIETRQKNKIKIKGSFKNGQLCGQGTYELENGDIYKGSFNKGLFQGYGVYTTKQSKLFKSISGEFCKSQPHYDPKHSEKLHKIQFCNMDKFQGTLKQGKIHGSQNVYTYQDGTIYKGAFYHNSMTGQCQISYPEDSAIQKYKGEVLDGEYNGLGVIQYRNGVILKGYFLKNAKNGPCILIYGQRMFKCLYVMDQLMGQLSQIVKNSL